MNITSAAQKLGGAGFYSAFLNASGRVLHDVFIYPGAQSKVWRGFSSSSENEDPGFMIEVDAKEVDALARHLKRFKLRAKVGIRVLDGEECKMYSAWGGSSKVDDDDSTSCVDNRAPGMGMRHVLLGQGNPPFEGEEVSLASYTVRRMMSGVPEGQDEILKETALPQESNIDYMGGIDFRKGCYVGQELTIRTHHTGVVRKRILPVQLYSVGEKMPEELAYDPKSKLTLPRGGVNISRVEKRGRSAGKFLGGIGNLGLALCRLETMTDTVLTGEGSQWRPDDEFKIAWEPAGGSEGGEIMTKAFVPEWHRERSDAQRVQRPSG